MRNRIVFAMGALLVLIVARGLEAHTTLRASSPEDGAALTTLPPSIRLEFNAAVNGGATAIRVIDTAEAARELEIRFDEATPSIVEGIVPTDLPSGAYRVAWRTLAADDHPLSGEFAFNLELPPPPVAVAPVEPAPTPAMVEESAESGSGAGTIALGVVGVGALAAAGYFLLRRSGSRGA